MDELTVLKYKLAYNYILARLHKEEVFTTTQAYRDCTEQEQEKELVLITSLNKRLAKGQAGIEKLIGRQLTLEEIEDGFKN